MHHCAANDAPIRLWQLGYLQGTSVQPDVSGFVPHFIIVSLSVQVKQCMFGESLLDPNVLSREQANPSCLTCWSLSLHAEAETRAAAMKTNEKALRMRLGYHLIAT
jgi:hypothetical protein